MARPALKTRVNRTNFSELTVRKLEDAFSDGMNNVQACLLAGVSESVFYEVCSKNPMLSERFRRLQEMPKVYAIKNIVKAIRKGDTKISQWYLERREKPHTPVKHNTETTFNYSEEAKKRMAKYT